MIQWIGTLIAASLALGSLCSPTISWAKPPDLPGGVLQQCPEGRERPEADGFGERLLPSEWRTSSPRDLDRNELKRAAERRDVDVAEEQDAPPPRSERRQPTERRRDVSVQPERLRERTRIIGDDVRHREMLRSTQPLETQPQRPMEECAVLGEEES